MLSSHFDDIFKIYRAYNVNWVSNHACYSVTEIHSKRHCPTWMRNEKCMYAIIKFTPSYNHKIGPRTHIYKYTDPAWLTLTNE